MRKDEPREMLTHGCQIIHHNFLKTKMRKENVKYPRECNLHGIP